MKLRRSSAPAAPAYTLVEVLVSISILALAIGAASRLSLSQTLSDDLNLKESFAVNYAENAARLWQLGITDPAPFLLRHLNADGTAMTVTYTIAPTAANGGSDGPANTPALMVQRTVTRVTYLPAGNAAAVTLDFPILRQLAERR